MAYKNNDASNNEKKGPKINIMKALEIGAETGPCLTIPPVHFTGFILKYIRSLYVKFMYFDLFSSP